MRSFLVPWLQLAVVQHLDLVLHGVEPVAAKRQQDLAEAGITINLNPMEQSVYLSEMRAQKLPMA